MRIGLVAPPWVPVPPPAYGGTEAVVDRLARGLQAAGQEVLLVATADSTCPVPQVPGTLPSDPEGMNEATSLMAHLVTGYAALGGVDVIHDHTVAGPLYRHRPAGIPVAVTNHGAFTAEALVFFAAIATEAAVVAISHDQASRAGDVPIARVIHHGIETDCVPPGAGDGGFAAFLGRMDPSKGVVEALRIARAAGVPLRIAAKLRHPVERAYYEAKVKPLLTSEHVYVGEVSDAEKFDLLGQAFALLNPIQWPEPFGLAMVEALACGTPVVGTGRGAAPEIVRPGVTGFLGDTADLVALLPRAGELDRAACRTDVERRFSVDRMVAAHVELYTELLQGC
jgi:glycosyltransferase involved in cell wall biosynthesis